jgi:hypothetical protein
MTTMSDHDLLRMVMAERFSTVDERRYMSTDESAYRQGNDEDA